MNSAHLIPFGLTFLMSPVSAMAQSLVEPDRDVASSGTHETAEPAAANKAVVDNDPGPPPQPFRFQTAMDLPEWFELNGSFRSRYSLLHNQFRPGLDRDDMALSLRTLVQAGVHFGPASFVAEFQDSRAYFDDMNSGVSTIVVNAVALLQSYIGLHGGSADKGAGSIDVRLGRQTLDLGGRRLIARNRFRNTIQNYNGLTAFWERKNTSITSFFVLPVTVKPENSDKEALVENRVEFDEERFGLRFFGLHAVRKELGLQINAEGYVYVLQEDDAPQTETLDRKLYTQGLRFFREPEPHSLDFEAEGTVQVGNHSVSTDPAAVRQDVLAQFAHGEIGWSFDLPGAPRLSAEIDYGSGDNPSTTGTYSRFDSLYGPRRTEFGPTGIYGLLGRENIVSQGLRVKVKPSERFDAFVSWRANWLPQPADRFARTVADPTGNSGNFAGNQVEFRTRTWLLPKSLLWELGGAAFINGEFLNSAPQATGYGNTLFGYTDLEAQF